MKMDSNIKIVEPDKSRDMRSPKAKEKKMEKDRKLYHENTESFSDGKVVPLPPPLPPAAETWLKKKTPAKSLRVSIPIKYLKSKQLIKRLESSKNKKSEITTAPMKSEYEDIENSGPIYKKHIMPIVPSPAYHKYPPKPFKNDTGTNTESKEYHNEESQTVTKDYKNKETQTEPIHIVDETDYKLMKDIKSFHGDITKLIATMKADNKKPVIETNELDNVQEKKKVDEEVINQVLRYSDNNKVIISKVLNIANIVETKDPRKKKENREFFGNMITQILNRSTGTEYIEETAPITKNLPIESSQINPDNIVISNQNEHTPNNQVLIPKQPQNELLEQHKKQLNRASQTKVQPDNPVILADYQPGQKMPNITIYKTREYPQASIDTGQNASLHKPRLSITASHDNPYSIGYTARTNTNHYEKHRTAQKKTFLAPTQHIIRKRQGSNLGHDLNQKQPKHISQYISYQHKMRSHPIHNMNLQLKHPEQENLMGHMHQQLQVVPLHHQVVPSYKQTSPVLHQTPQMYNHTPHFLNQRQELPSTQINQPPHMLHQQSLYPEHLPGQHAQQQISRGSTHYSVISREQAMEIQQKVWESHLANYPNADWSSALWSANRT